MAGARVWSSAVLAAGLLWGGVSQAGPAREREVQCRAMMGTTQHELTLTLGADGVVTAFDYGSFDETNSKNCGVHAARDEGDNEPGHLFDLDWKTRPNGTVQVQMLENRYDPKVVATATISRRNGGYRFSLDGDVSRFCPSPDEPGGTVYLAPVAVLTPGQATCRLEKGGAGQVRVDEKATAAAQRIPHPYDPATDPPPPYEYGVVGIRAYYYHQETGVAGGEDLALGHSLANMFGDADGPSGATWVLVDLERRPAQRTPVQQLRMTAQVPGRVLLNQQVGVGDFFSEKKGRISIPFLVYGTGCEELKLHAVLSTAGRKETQVVEGKVPFGCTE